MRHERRIERYSIETSIIFLLPQGGIIDADKSGNGGANQDTPVATVDGIVQANNRELGQEAAEGDALSVDNVGQESLDDAEGQGVNDSLVEGTGAGSGASLAVGVEVEEVAKSAGDQNAGKDPGKGGRPEAGSQKQEHIGKIDGVVRSANSADCGNGESIAVAENLWANVVELKGGDAEQDAGDGAERLTGSARSLCNTTFLVHGIDALAHGEGGTVDGMCDVSGRGGQRDAGSYL